jgi:hypothetical protein
VEEVVGWKGREGEKDIEGRRQRGECGQDFRNRSCYESGIKS